MRSFHPDSRRPIGRVLVLAAVLSVLSGLSSAQEAKVPRAVVPGSIADVGRVAKGEVVEHAFEIRNEGDAPLRIDRVKPTCGCTVASYDEVIAPGTSGTLEAKLDTAEFRGPIAKSIRVFTNDTSNPEVTLVIKADVRAQIDISPGYARFVVVQGEDYGTKRQIIWAPDFPTLKITRVISPFDYVHVTNRQLEEGDSDYRRDENRWELDVALTEEAPTGPMADFIRIVTNHPRQKVVRIPVSGIVRPILAVTPQVADFGRRETTLEHQATLEVKNLGRTAVTVESASTDVEGLTAEVESVEAGRLFNLVLTLEKGIEKGRFRGTVTIKTTSPDQPTVEVDVIGNAI